MGCTEMPNIVGPTPGTIDARSVLRTWKCEQCGREVVMTLEIYRQATHRFCTRNCEMQAEAELYEMDRYLDGEMTNGGQA